MLRDMEIWGDNGANVGEDWADLGWDKVRRYKWPGPGRDWAKGKYVTSSHLSHNTAKVLGPATGGLDYGQ